MKYRSLGKTGLKVSEIGLGTNNFGGKTNEQDGTKVINCALDSGINFIDTADVYSKGGSEEIIGKVLKGKRSDVIIATKFSGLMGTGPNDRGASRYHVLKAIEESLKRLNTDFIDLYYIHRPDPTTPIEETLQCLDTLVKSGKVRYIGCSNFAAWQLTEAIWISRVNHLESFAVIESEYNVLQRQIETEVVPCCQNYGISVIPWSPLAGGFLTGKYEREKNPGADTRFADPHFNSSKILTEANFDKIDMFKRYASEHSHTVQELAIAWLLSHPWLCSVITGATTSEQVAANVAAADWLLTPEDMSQINKLLTE